MKSGRLVERLEGVCGRVYGSRGCFEMTRQARAVLSACELALDELSADPSYEQWMLRWFTAVALLRSVGHVLRSTDRAAGDAMRTAIDDAYERWRADRSAHTIYWRFILEERNRAMKEFTFGAGRGVVIEPPTGRFERDSTGKLRHVNPDEEGRVWHTYEMVRGHFKGQDQRDMVRHAIKWWEQQLDQIDREAAAAD